MTALDVIVRLLAFLGLPSVLASFVGYLMYHRRKVRASDRTAEVNADVDEETAPLRIRSSSIVTLEAELAALAKSFETDRAIKGETIDYLRRSLDEERAASERKDAKIHELEEKVGALQLRVRDLTEELGRVADDLADLHTPTPDTTKEK